jgi:hypothetical protein
MTMSTESIFDKVDRERREGLAKRSAHELVLCERTGHGYYSYRNWSSTFRCPLCGRSGRFSLNFLGQRNVMCGGNKFTKVPK